ncbi:DUF3632 domain-containing protein [Aspergillus homomorphus CBS 101889]|uniref:Uncharacterized protein n=1 Tax=Aspergillus homomorphus (strain CBS 101889) TaxID=1450537 RepID=A0A395I1C2_ASPHC|nr:hypothetical protein BO97DRAFT_433397 [Aspergillus homomorphus CBS 101889]RAL13860.1 hypothetical protein BO97DRAFT_433397 [Aspergillus homomorphus CBS 101889]
MTAKAMTATTWTPTTAESATSVLTSSPSAVSTSGLGGELGHLWHRIVNLAAQNPHHHDKLVDLLVDMAHLPTVIITTASPSLLPPDEAEDEPRNHQQQQQPVHLYDRQVWRDLPLLGWEIRWYWDTSIPARGSTNKTSRDAEPVFYVIGVWLVLVTFRTALETPRTPREERDEDGDALEAWVPAAAAWIEVLGAEIYEWEEEFPAGPLRGAPGSGGPLWNGKHGFCRESWRLWRERFGEISCLEWVEVGIRSVARKAELMMREIENGEVV